MGEIKTIRRNAHKKIAAIREQRTRCLCYSLDNSFSGKEVSPSWAWGQYEKYDFARLVYHPDHYLGAVYRISVHSNLFFDLHLPDGE